MQAKFLERILRLMIFLFVTKYISEINTFYKNEKSD
jgi:hypothetical protein